MRRFVPLLALLTIAAPALAQPPGKAVAPEALLPADAAFFLRYDGHEPHKKAYDQTALAKAMKDDLGEFLDYISGFLRDQAIKDLFRGKVNEQVPVQWDSFMKLFWKNGIAVGVEIEGALPRRVFDLPRFDLEGDGASGATATVVFPQAGADKGDAVMPLLAAVVRSLGNPDDPNNAPEIKQKKIGGRDVSVSQAPEGFSIAWWKEGAHVVLVVGTGKVERAIEVATGKRKNLTESALHKAVASHKGYETDLRGGVDLEKVVDVLRVPPPGEDKAARVKEAIKRGVILNQIGLLGMKNLTFHYGFDGKFQRSTWALSVVEPKERRGLLRLISSGPPIADGDLPPLPPRAETVWVFNTDWKVIVEELDRTIRLLDLGEAMRGRPWRGLDLPELKELLKFDLKKEVVDHLDSPMALCINYPDGPFVLGMSVAIKVKDEKKLVAGMKKAMKLLAETLPGGGNGGERGKFETTKYRGADLHVLQSERHFPIPFTWTVHKGWFVMGAFPPAVKGHVLRSEGKLARWKLPAHVEESIQALHKEAGPGAKVVGVRVADPKQEIEIGLSLLPIVVEIARGFPFGPRRNELPFDVSKVPSAQSITEHLFENVTLTVDTGTSIRWESRFSVDVPWRWALIPGMVPYWFWH